MRPDLRLMISGLSTGLVVILCLLGCTKSAGDGDPAGSLWFVVDTIRSEIDGSVHLNTSLRLFGKEGPEGSPKNNNAILSFICARGGTPGMAVITDQSLETGLIDSRWKVDDQPPSTEQGYIGSSSGGSMVVFTVPLDSFFGTIYCHKRLLIEYEGHGENSKTVAEFQLQKLQSFRRPLMASCEKR